MPLHAYKIVADMQNNMPDVPSLHIMPSSCTDNSTDGAISVK